MSVDDLKFWAFVSWVVFSGLFAFLGYLLRHEFMTSGITHPFGLVILFIVAWSALSMIVGAAVTSVGK